MKKVYKVKQIKDIVLNDGTVYPLSPIVHIELDKKSRVRNKLHQVYLQQGRCYGTVGDQCSYITHQELFELEAKGMIEIN